MSPNSSRSMISPIWLISTTVSPSRRVSFAYILSTSPRSFLTAATRFLLAGPPASCSGLIMEGFIGLVEFGSMAGSQLAAGRSYHGVDASPCMDGSRNGASRADEAVASFCMAVSPFASVLSFAFVGPSATAARSFSSTGPEKKAFSSQTSIRSFSCPWCFGAFVKAAALLNSGRTCGSMSATKVWFWVRNFT